MTALREAMEATHKRDASVSSTETHWTNPTDFVEDLKRDASIGAIEDNLVRLAIINATATVEQIEGVWTPGGQRPVLTYQSKHVEASYVARGSLHKLSCYCGVALKDNVTNPAWIEAGKERPEATGKALQQALRKVQAAIDPLGLDVRGGRFYVPDGPWTSHPDGAIETPPTLTCAVCGVDIYWANNAWRGPNGKAEVWVDDGVSYDRRPKKRLDHEHAIEVTE
jgi:hypothetical protein